MKQARRFSRGLDLARKEALEGDSTLIEGLHVQIGEVLRLCPEIVDFVMAGRIAKVLRTQHEIDSILSNRK